MNRVIFCLLLCCGWSSLFGADEDSLQKTDYLLVRSHYGFLIAHRENMNHIPQNHVYGLEINYEVKSRGGRPWHEKYRYPYFGFGVFAANVGNTQVLGDGFSAFGYLKAFLSKKDRKIVPRMKMGAGLGYITNPFDRLSNHKNNAIGSHFNIFVTTQFDATYYFRNWQAGLGFSFSHFSNGCFRLPNLGINLPTLNLSMGYVFKKRPPLPKQTVEISDKPWHFTAVATAGVKDVETGKHDLYPSYNLLLRARRNTAKKSAWGLGADLMYNTSLRRRMEIFQYTDPETTPIVQAGVCIAYYQRFNNLALFINNGIYLYSKFTDDGIMYHRFGAEYTLGNNLIVQFSLKTHWAKADHFEIGIGYRIR